MLFKRKRYKDGTREIYFCGLKIFKYKKEANSLVAKARAMGVKIGNNVELISLPNWGSEPYFIEIGDDVLISFEVAFLTHDGSVFVCQKYCKEDIAKVGKIKIGNNCFIGCRSTILPNVTIGDNSVIGACSVVTKNVPEGEVWAGNPAKFICKTEDLARKMENNCKTPEQIELKKFVAKIRCNDD